MPRPAYGTNHHSMEEHLYQLLAAKIFGEANSEQLHELEKLLLQYPALQKRFVVMEKILGKKNKDNPEIPAGVFAKLENRLSLEK